MHSRMWDYAAVCFLMDICKYQLVPAREEVLYSASMVPRGVGAGQAEGGLGFQCRGLGEGAQRQPTLVSVRSTYLFQAAEQGLNLPQLIHVLL